MLRQDVWSRSKWQNWRTTLIAKVLVEVLLVMSAKVQYRQPKSTRCCTVDYYINSNQPTLGKNKITIMQQPTEEVIYSDCNYKHVFDNVHSTRQNATATLLTLGIHLLFQGDVIGVKTFRHMDSTTHVWTFCPMGDSPIDVLPHGREVSPRTRHFAPWAICP